MSCHFFLFSKSVMGEDWACGQARTETKKEISRRRKDWRVRVKAALQGSVADTRGNPPSNPRSAWAIVSKTRMERVNSSDILIIAWNAGVLLARKLLRFLAFELI